MLWQTGRDAVLLSRLSHSVCAHQTRAKVPAVGNVERVLGFGVVDVKLFSVLIVKLFCASDRERRGKECADVTEAN